jgi:hypothetical protein
MPRSHAQADGGKIGKEIMQTRNKYGNRNFTDQQGNRWDSEKEYYRYVELRKAEADGRIQGLQRQVVFSLLPAVTEEQTVQLKTKTKTVTKTVQQPVTYRADFVYMKDGQQIVEDVKGSPRMLTKEYLIKKKFMRGLLGITIKEVYHATDEI